MFRVSFGARNDSDNIHVPSCVASRGWQLALSRLFIVCSCLVCFAGGGHAQPRRDEAQEPGGDGDQGTLASRTLPDRDLALFCFPSVDANFSVEGQ